MFVGHLSIFWIEEMSTQIICQFFTWVVILLLHYKSSLYNLEMRPLSDKWFANIAHGMTGGLSLHFFFFFQSLHFLDKFSYVFIWLLVLLVSYLRPVNILKLYPLITVQNTAQETKMDYHHPPHPFFQKLLVVGPAEEIGSLISSLCKLFSCPFSELRHSATAKASFR